MAQERMAPRFLGKTNKQGVPVFAIIFTNLFGFLSLMNLSTGGGKAYSYIINLSGVSAFLVWGSISVRNVPVRGAFEINTDFVHQHLVHTHSLPTSLESTGALP
jgi:amino acid transporter